jgi:hypothetical protein
MTMEADEVADRIWVGKHPDEFTAGAPVPTIVVACAYNLQTRPSGFDGRLIGCPLHDNAFRILEGEVELAERAAATVADLLSSPGQSVLFTCREGLNRSAWVAALTLVARGEPRAAAVAAVKANRPGSLYNWFFDQHASTGKDPSP